MKHIKPALLIMALCALTLSACKKSKSDPKPAAINMSLKFNGVARSTTFVLATTYPNGNESSTQISGNFGSTQGLSLMVPNIKVGTYDVSSFGVIASFSLTPDFANTFLGTSGSITISSITSDTISGTFEFTGINPAEEVGTVTEGKFTAKIVNITN